MKTWADIQAFIAKHSLSYRVMRWNMSLRGCLINDFDNAVAYTVKDAERYLRGTECLN